MTTKISEHQKESAELSQKLQTSSSQHILQADELSARLRSVEEQNSKLRGQEAELKSVVSKLMLAVQQAELKADQKVQREKEQLLDEFDRIMAEKILHQKKEVEDLKISHSKRSNCVTYYYFLQFMAKHE